MKENLAHLLLFGISGPVNLTLFLLSQPLIPELLAWAMCVFLYWFIFPWLQCSFRFMSISTILELMFLDNEM